MGKFEPPGKPPKKGLATVIVEYVSLAGSIFLIVNFLKDAKLSEAAAILTSATGQGLLVLFGALSIAILWMVGKLRS